MRKHISTLVAALLLAALLTGCGSSAPAVSSAPAGDSAKVAASADMAPAQEVGTKGMTPVPADSLKDGTYPVTVDSSSSMFRVTDCALTVSGGSMTAAMTMGGTGYQWVYPGTAEEAAAGKESDYISYTENADGAHTFTLPVEALDKEIPCAAFSKKKQMWYDRTLVFRADSLPAEALSEGAVTSPESLKLEDGCYTVAVTLEGGSGRATVESPAALAVKKGKCTAIITWSSPNYDYMKVNGKKYLPTNKEGNSVFKIPVTGFDCKMPVVGDTTAMSEPHEIDYTLFFDSATIQEKK